MHFADIVVFWVFFSLQTEGLWLSKSIGAIFPKASAHFESLCRNLEILALFQTSLLLYLLWWSVLSGLWYYSQTDDSLLKAQTIVSIF